MKESDKKERRKRMKVSVWNNIGDYSRSLDIEYNSELETDCVQAEKYIIALTRSLDIEYNGVRRSEN